MFFIEKNVCTSILHVARITYEDKNLLHYKYYYYH